MIFRLVEEADEDEDEEEEPAEWSALMLDKLEFTDDGRLFAATDVLAFVAELAAPPPPLYDGFMHSAGECCCCCCCC